MDSATFESQQIQRERYVRDQYSRGQDVEPEKINSSMVLRVHDRQSNQFVDKRFKFRGKNNRQNKTRNNSQSVFLKDQKDNQKQKAQRRTINGPEHSESISVSLSVGKKGQPPAPGGDSSMSINHDQSLVSTIGSVFRKNRESLTVAQVGGGGRQQSRGRVRKFPKQTFEAPALTPSTSSAQHKKTPTPPKRQQPTQILKQQGKFQKQMQGQDPNKNRFPQSSLNQ